MVPRTSTGGGVRWAVGYAAAIVLSVMSAAARAADPPYMSLRINEVIANNNTVQPVNCNCKHVDMVEIYNPTAVQIKLYDTAPGGGKKALRLSDGAIDNDVVQWWEFGPGQKINPNGRFVVFCDKDLCKDAPSGSCANSIINSQYEAHASFKLDNQGETLTLFGPEGEVIDQVTFPALAADVSWGRFPDGADSFAFFPRFSDSDDQTSFGTCTRPAVIPGIECSGAANSARQPENVPPSIDLRDFSTNDPRPGEPVVIQGEVKDDRLLEPGDIAQVAIVYRVNGGAEREEAMDFIRFDTDLVNVFDHKGIWEGRIPGQPDGSVVEFYLRVRDQSNAEGTQPGTLCPYPEGPCPDVLPPDCPATCQVPYQYYVGARYGGPLVMNEVVAENQSIIKDTSEQLAFCADQTQDCHYDDFVEIYNQSDQPQPLSGLFLSSKPFHASDGWTFPTYLEDSTVKDSMILGHQHLLVWVDGDGDPPPGGIDPNDPRNQEFHTSFGLDGRSDEVYLFAAATRPDGKKYYRVLDGLRWGRHGEPIEERGTFVPFGETWSFYEGTQSPPDLPDPEDPGRDLTWEARGYADSSWETGPAPVGYGAAGVATSLPGMRGNYLTLYLRKKFTIPDAFFDTLPLGEVKMLVKRLYLEVIYDDGIRVYLNHHRVADLNLPEWGFDRPAGEEVGSPVRRILDITNFKDKVQQGIENALAVEVHNASLTSPDLVFDARLFWGVEGLGDDESLARIPDGSLTAPAVKLSREFVTPRQANSAPTRLFRRGDASFPADGSVDLNDVIAILWILFVEVPSSACLDAADVDNSGELDLSDPIALLTYLFLDGPAPAAPGPLYCGYDPGPDDGLPDCADPVCN